MTSYSGVLFTGVRLAAAESLPFLLDCARIKGQDYLQNVWLFMLPPLLQSIDSEPEADIRAEHMHSLAMVRHVTSRHLV